MLKKLNFQKELLLVKEFEYTNAILLYRLETLFTMTNFYDRHFFNVHCVCVVDYIIEKMYEKYGDNTDIWQDFKDKSEFDEIIEKMGLKVY